MSSSHPEGLISFMYWVMYDDKINEEFHRNESGTMNNFHLEATLQSELVRLGRNHDNPKGEPIADQMLNRYLLVPFLQMWNEYPDVEFESFANGDPRQGWLSFMYHVTYQSKLRKAFLVDAVAVLEKFAITDDRAIAWTRGITQDLAAGRMQAAAAKAKQIFDTYISEELLQTTPPKFW